MNVPPSVRQRRLAQELRRMRELSLITANEAARSLKWSASKISRMENAQIRLQPADVRRLLDLYQAPPDRREELEALAAEGDRKEWWYAYRDVITPEFMEQIEFERDAVAIRESVPMAFPGLLQTEAYTAAMVSAWARFDRRPPTELPRRTEVRMLRQRVFSSENPPSYVAIVDQAVLVRKVGGAQVMADQLRHLLTMSHRPNITIRVLSLAGADLVPIDTFMLMDFSDFQTVLVTETLFTSSVDMNPDGVNRYSLIFDNLRAAAEPEDKSRAIIEEAMAEFQDEPS
jgi:hypothetical protein